MGLGVIAAMTMGREDFRPDVDTCHTRRPQEPEDEDEEGEGNGAAFDFEAHMARLIERSERSLGFVAARGWEEGELEGLERVCV